MAWQVANAKAKFSELLDSASRGPQVVHRRKQTFIITTEAEIQKRLTEARNGKRETFLSAWEALGGSDSGILNDDEFKEFSAALREARG